MINPIIRLTSEILREHDNQRVQIEFFIDELARKVAEYRGKPVPPDRNQWGVVHNRYAFEKFEVWDESIQVTYFWSHQGGGDYFIVNFPVSYLDIDWTPIEQKLVDEEQRKMDDRFDAKMRMLM